MPSGRKFLPLTRRNYTLKTSVGLPQLIATWLREESLAIMHGTDRGGRALVALGEMIPCLITISLRQWQTGL